VTELAAVQLQLLNNVAGSVKPGGKLIYAVCTLTQAETVDVVTAFSTVHPEFEPMALPKISESPNLLASAPTTTIWPQDCGGNGMFIAGWRRSR
jgi:16S rRNA (cytosine967-C5)-methyltransferase